MKTTKIFLSVILVSFCLVSYSQSTATNAKTNVYYVQVPHKPEQCANLLMDMKGKGDAFLSKFEFGCMSGDHTGYAFLNGNSEADVRQMLPKDEQSMAKVQKVDKFTAAQIEEIHKSHMTSDTKK
jgi:hypothetical protein